MKKLFLPGMIVIMILIFRMSPAIYGDPPPMPGQDHGTSTNQNGAPIDGGLGILLISGAAYAAARIYHRKNSGNRRGEPE